MTLSRHVLIVAFNIYVSGLCISKPAEAQLSAEESCLGVLKYSKVTQTEAATLDSYEEIQSDYCDEQERARSSGSSASFNARWKVLGAGMSRANSSSQEIYSKYCKENGTIRRDEETRNAVAESLSREAFAAFRSCLEMHANEVRFGLANISRRAMEYNIPVRFASTEANADAILTYALTRDNADGGTSNCNWVEPEGPSVEGRAITMRGNTQTSLHCSRDETATRDNIDITVQRIDSSVGGMVFRWRAYERQAGGRWLAVDKVGQLEKEISTLTTRLDGLSQEFAQDQQTLGSLAAFRESHAHVPLAKMRWHNVKNERIYGNEEKAGGGSYWSREFLNDRDYAIVVSVASTRHPSGNFCELGFKINGLWFRGPIGGSSIYATCEMSMLVPPRANYQVQFKHSVSTWNELFLPSRTEH